jgi:hypothetical protein
VPIVRYRKGRATIGNSYIRGLSPNNRIIRLVTSGCFLSIGRCQLDERWTRGRPRSRWGSRGRWNPGYIAPRAEGLVPDGAIVDGREAVTAKLKVIVDPAVVERKCCACRGALHQDVEHVPVPIDCTPEIMQLAADAEKHLIHKPFVARPWPTPLQRVGKQPTEAQAPFPDAFVADHHAAGGQDRLDVTQAEAEAAIQPDRMFDDLGRKAKAVIGLGEVVMLITLPRRPSIANLTTPSEPPGAVPSTLSWT